ncbi:hypothetical protein DL93DRAFT_1760789 [Clavulina sp. PMI_390]|nr:hypothetical protein DL93DRAFT_1760789 [Clavulina sp. PMI_390]
MICHQNINPSGGSLECTEPAKRFFFFFWRIRWRIARVAPSPNLHPLLNQAYSTAVFECSTAVLNSSSPDDSHFRANAGSFSFPSRPRTSPLTRCRSSSFISTLCATPRVHGLGITSRSMFRLPTSNCAICRAFLRVRGRRDQGRKVCQESTALVLVSIDTAPALFNRSRLQLFHSTAELVLAQLQAHILAVGLSSTLHSTTALASLYQLLAFNHLVLGPGPPALHQQAPH